MKLMLKKEQKQYNVQYAWPTFIKTRNQVQMGPLACLSEWCEDHVDINFMERAWHSGCLSRCSARNAGASFLRFNELQ